MFAKFLEAMMQRNGEVECVKQILHPRYFKDVMYCAKKVFSYCPKTDTFKNIFSSYYVAQGLRFCAQFEQRRLSMDGLNDKPIKNFLKQLEIHVCNKVSRTGPKQYLPQDHMLNKVAEDVSKLSEFLIKEMDNFEDQLKDGEKDPELLLGLLKSTLSAMVLLNAPNKRIVETVTVDEFNGIIYPDSKESEMIKVEKDTDNKELIENLLTQDLYKLKKESRGNVITLVMTEDMKRALDLCLKLRNSFGVNSENAYLFPRVYHSSLFCLKGTICLKENIRLAGLKEPTNLLSSELDRTVARMFNTIQLPITGHGPLVGAVNSFSKINLTALEPTNPLQIAYIADLMSPGEFPFLCIS